MARVKITVTDPVNRLTLEALLKAEGHEVTGAEPDVEIVDACAAALERARTGPVLILTPAPGIRDAVAAMRQGVFGYILLPFIPGEAAIMVDRAVAWHRHDAGFSEDATNPSRPKRLDSLETVEMRHIQKVLRACSYNQTEAARILGMGRNTLWRKLARRQMINGKTDSIPDLKKTPGGGGYEQ